jgi:hypothetical protein
MFQCSSHGSHTPPCLRTIFTGRYCACGQWLLYCQILDWNCPHATLTTTGGGGSTATGDPDAATSGRILLTNSFHSAIDAELLADCPSFRMTGTFVVHSNPTTFCAGSSHDLKIGRS